MPETPGIREVAPNRPIYTNQIADMAKGLNLNEKGQALVKEVVGLLFSERNVRVNNVPANSRAETGTVNGPTGTPSIDNPDDSTAKEIDLEKLLMYLQLESSEEQAAEAKKRIDAQKDSLDSQHKERLEKLEETLKKMDEAAASSLFSKIFGWLLAAVAVVVAVAACVATGGLALGPVIGAVIAVGACVLNETGAMDEIVKGLADVLEAMGMSKDAAKVVAQVMIAVAIIAASLACGGAGAATALSDSATAVQQAAANIQKLADIAMKVLAVASTITNGVAAYTNYASGEAQAELTETNKLLQQLRQQLEESQEELQKILEMIQNTYSNLVAILDSETDTQKSIANQIGQMA